MVLELVGGDGTGSQSPSPRTEDADEYGFDMLLEMPEHEPAAKPSFNKMKRSSSLSALSTNLSGSLGGDLSENMSADLSGNLSGNLSANLTGSGNIGGNTRGKASNNSSSPIAILGVTTPVLRGVNRSTEALKQQMLGGSSPSRGRGRGHRAAAADVGYWVQRSPGVHRSPGQHQHRGSAERISRSSSVGSAQSFESVGSIGNEARSSSGSELYGSWQDELAMTWLSA